MAEQRYEKVLLAGASGYIGRYVAAELVARGYTPVALVRDSARVSSQLPGCQFINAEVTDRSGLRAALEDIAIDAVVSCIASRSGAPKDAWSVDHQANCNLLSLAQHQGARHFVLLSAICVQRPRLEFQHAKLAFEEALVNSDMDYSIVRPTAFFKSLAGQVERVKAGKPFLVFGDGRLTACKPIAEADLARFIVDCLEDPSLANRVLPLGGPGPAITPLEQGELLCRLAGRPVKIRQVSPRVFDAVTTVLSPLSRIVPSLEAKAEFARIGQYYATESMLLWDATTQRYDADATPSYGDQTLEGFYTRVLQDGLAGQELGEHKLF